MVRGLTVSLSGRRVLDGIDLDLPRGARTALVAPSGAGKSTLMRALVRLVPVDGGTVELDGRDVTGIEATVLRRRIGYVAQVPAMLPGTVADNLAYGVGDLAPDLLRRAMERSALSEAMLERDARELSGGEQVRVGLARALTRGPDVLLLDEPTAMLDRAAADSVATTLRALAGEALAICVATHDEAFAAGACDAAVELR